MSPLLAPILAQLVTLGVADSSEVRYVHTDYSRWEAATIPRAGLNFAWQRSNLTIGYAPMFTLAPLESNDRQLTVFHYGTVTASYRFRRTAFYATQAMGYGELNFYTQAYAAPGTTPITVAPSSPVPGSTGTPAVPAANPGGLPPGTTGTGTQAPLRNVSQLPATNRVVEFVSLVSTVGVSQLVSSVLTVNGTLYYLYSSSLGDTADIYPPVQGPGATAAATYRVSPLDGLISTLTFQYTLATIPKGQIGAGTVGNYSTLLVLNETWAHRLDPRTTTTVGAGLSNSRNSLADGTVFYSIFPTFNAGITHVTPFARSAATFGGNAYAAPVVDPLLATVNPRFTLSAFAGWNEKRFSTVLNVASAVSIGSYANQGAFNSITGSLTANYQLADAVALNTGVRSSWQSFEGITTVPLGYAVFAGVSFGAVFPLNH